MLSFFELNNILEKNRKRHQDINEVSDDLIKKLEALKSKFAKPAKPQAGQPTQIDTPAPVPANPPAVPPRRTRPPVPSAPAKNTSLSPNDPQSPEFASHFEKDILDRDRQGIKMSSPKAQSNTASKDVKDERLARDAENVQIFNNMLISNDHGPSQRALVAMAVHDLKLPYEIPDGPFELATMSRGSQARANEVIMPTRDIMRIMRKVNDYTRVDKGREGYGQNLSFKQALAQHWDKLPNFNPVIRRSLELERNILHPQVVGQEMSLSDLANAVGEITGNPQPELDARATSYLIRTALDNGFGHFFDVKGNPRDPNTIVRVKSPSEAGTIDHRDDGTMKPRSHRIGNALDRAKSAWGAPQQPPKSEANEWMDVMDMMEHWNL